MRQEGFTAAEIEAVFGYMPPIDMDREVVFAILDRDLAAEEDEFGDEKDDEDFVPADQ